MSLKSAVLTTTLRVLEIHQILTNGVHPKKFPFQLKILEVFPTSLLIAKWLQMSMESKSEHIYLGIQQESIREAVCCNHIFIVQPAVYATFSHMLLQYVSHDIPEILSPAFCPYFCWFTILLFSSLAMLNYFTFLELLNPKNTELFNCSWGSF